MKRSYFKKITSFLLITSILLPLVVGFTHVLHNHEHNVCKSKTVKHVHSKKSNCSNFHYFSDIQYKDALKNIDIDEPGYFKSTTIRLNSLFFITSIFSNFQRGPPSVNDF